MGGALGGIGGAGAAILGGGGGGGGAAAGSAASNVPGMAGTGGGGGLKIEVEGAGLAPVTLRLSGFGGAIVPKRMLARCFALPAEGPSDSSSSDSWERESTIDQSSSVVVVGASKREDVRCAIRGAAGAWV